MTDRRKKYNDHVVRRVTERYASGTQSVRHIAEDEGVPVATVYEMLKRVGMKPTRKPEAIAHPDDTAAIELYDITVHQELIIDQMAAEADRLRSVLDRGD